MGTGAPKADPKDMPPPANFVEGWGIPKPDVTFQLPMNLQFQNRSTSVYQPGAGYCSFGSSAFAWVMVPTISAGSLVRLLQA